MHYGDDKSSRSRIEDGNTWPGHQTSTDCLKSRKNSTPFFHFNTSRETMLIATGKIDIFSTTNNEAYSRRLTDILIFFASKA